MTNNRIPMAVDTQDEDAPIIFMMGCLSPSTEEAEPPTKIFEAESPKCASLLAFSRDDDDDDEESLMAAGLAWVSLSPKSHDPLPTNITNIYEARYPIEQQLKERLEHQKRLDRLNSTATAPPSTPGRAIDTNTEMTIQSCPTSPSFMSRVYTNLAKIPLPNSTTSTPLRNNKTELSPRVNTIYDTFTPTGSKEEDATSSTSYFCQEESSKSPTRSTLIQVLARIGSSYDQDEEFLEEDDDDSILEDDEDDIHGVSWIPPVRCVSASGTSSILTPQQMHQIARHVLPKGIASCQWNRLYSLVRDGDSFDVCLHYARHDARTLLVVRTTRGAILGGYAGDVWSPKGEGYYGKSDTCLFTFETKHACENIDPRAQSPVGGGNATVLKTPARPTTVVAPLTPQSPPLVRRPKKSLLDEDNYEASLPPIRVHRYTGVNRYIQYCDANKKMMAFGGGGEDGSFGLCVEQEFQGGSTGPCDTFDNEPLCDQENFKIVDVELWGFLTGQF